MTSVPFLCNLLTVVTLNPRDRLREWMALSKLSQPDLAAMLNITQPHVSRIVVGERRPSLSLAVRIERVTGIPATSWVEGVNA